MVVQVIKILFLDDERSPSDVTWVKYSGTVKFTVVRTREEFQWAVLTNPRFDIFSLDHDLQDFDHFSEKENTGFSCLYEVASSYRCKLPKQVIAHSKNPIGAEKINNLFNFVKGLKW